MENEDRDIIEFSDFKYCKMSTSEILEKVPFKERERNDFMKYLYSLLFYTDIRIDDKLDLYKVIKSYMWYQEGHIATIIM